MFNPASLHPIPLETGPGRFNPDAVSMLRTLGRGAHGCRSLSREQARTYLRIKDFRKKVVSFSESFEAFKVKEEQELGNGSPATSSGA